MMLTGSVIPQPLLSGSRDTQTALQHPHRPLARKAAKVAAQATPTSTQDPRVRVEMDRWWDSEATDSTADISEDYWTDPQMGSDLREQGAFGDELEEELELGASDPESRAAAVSLAIVAQDTRAQDVQVLQVGHMVSWTSYFVLVTVTSQPQMTAVLAKIAREAKEKLDWAALRPVDGRSPWEVLDYGEVVVHCLFPFERSHYNLEGKYARALQVELPAVGPGDGIPDWRKNLNL